MRGNTSRRLNQRQARLCSLVALFALVSILALPGCGSASPQAQTTHTATPLQMTPPTATSAPSPHVIVIPSGGDPVAGNAPFWQAATLPTGFGDLFHDSTVAIAPSDGETAYACAAPSALTPQASVSYPQVITTHDRGLYWSAPVALPFQAGSCTGVFADQLNAQNAIILDDNGADEYITRDGGQSWNLLTFTAQLVVRSFATVGARTYGFITRDAAPACLAQSDNQMRTWRCIDDSLRAINGQAYELSFWVNPASGALLLETQIPSGGVDLWRSDDDGHTWAPVITPAPAGDVLDTAVQQPYTTQPWHICVLNFVLEEVFCTTDGGAIWTQEPQFWPANGGLAQSISLVGLPGDGSVIISRNTGSSPTLYRLPVGGVRWQNLGADAPPTGGTYFFPGANGVGGVIWAVPAEGDGASTGDQPNEFYSASYPY